MENISENVNINTGTVKDYYQSQVPVQPTTQSEQNQLTLILAKLDGLTSTVGNLQVENARLKKLVVDTNPKKTITNMIVQSGTTGRYSVPRCIYKKEHYKLFSRNILLFCIEHNIVNKYDYDQYWKNTTRSEIPYYYPADFTTTYKKFGFKGWSDLTRRIKATKDQQLALKTETVPSSDDIHTTLINDKTDKHKTLNLINKCSAIGIKHSKNPSRGNINKIEKLICEHAYKLAFNK